MNHVSEISRKLARISEVMNDGYIFLYIREICEQWQADADMGSAEAQEMMESIDTFYRLCDYMKKTHSTEL